jgi:hypothetical protein
MFHATALLLWVKRQRAFPANRLLPAPLAGILWCEDFLFVFMLSSAHCAHEFVESVIHHHPSLWGIFHHFPCCKVERFAACEAVRSKIFLPEPNHEVSVYSTWRPGPQWAVFSWGSVPWKPWHRPKFEKNGLHMTLTNSFEYVWMIFEFAPRIFRKKSGWLHEISPNSLMPSIHLVHCVVFFDLDPDFMWTWFQNEVPLNNSGKKCKFLVFTRVIPWLINL